MNNIITTNYKLLHAHSNEIEVDCSTIGNSVMIV